LSSSVDTSNDGVKCSLCGKSFKTRFGLSIHIGVKHNEKHQVNPTPAQIATEESSSFCYICGRDFRNPFGLRIHMGLVHPEYKRRVFNNPPFVTPANNNHNGDLLSQLQEALNSGIVFIIVAPRDVLEKNQKLFKAFNVPIYGYDTKESLHT
jgi:hypothetical protein